LHRRIDCLDVSYCLQWNRIENLRKPDNESIIFCSENLHIVNPFHHVSGSSWYMFS
jgi:hypothetical protein